MINKINSDVDFKGGFRFKNIPAEAKEKLPAYISKHRQIFDNFEKEGDVFLTVRDEADKKVYKFIRDNKLDFEYYSKISTKSGLDNERHGELTELIKKNNEKPIKTLKELKDRLFKGVVYQNIQSKALDKNTVETLLKPLCMDLEGKEITVKNKFTIVNDKEFTRKVIISPKSRHDVHYVMLKPDSANQSALRYAISADGEIVSGYNTPEGIMNFYKQVNNLIKEG